MSLNSWDMLLIWLGFGLALDSSLCIIEDLVVAWYCNFMTFKLISLILKILYYQGAV